MLVTTGSWYSTHSQATESFFCWRLDVLTFRVSDTSWSLPQCTSLVALLVTMVGLSGFSAGLGFVGHEEVF